MTGGSFDDNLFDPATAYGRDLASVDWAATGFGPESSWPPSLRNVVRLMLGSRFPMWLAWGPELTFLCNDAYRRDTLGVKYPWAIGRPATEVWAEIWDDIGPRINSVITTGVATWDESLLLFLERSGYQEETYHTFSYSPVSDDSGQINGMLCVVSEDTARVVGERRMATLRDLGASLARASTESEVNEAASRTLGTDTRNLTFAAAYALDQDSHPDAAVLAWSVNLAGARSIAPDVVRLDQLDAPWPTSVVASGTTEVIDASQCRFTGRLPSGAWDTPSTHLVLAPLVQPGAVAPIGFLLVGLNPYRAFDDEYRGFIDLVAGQVAAGIVRARAYEQERRRAEDLAELDRAKTSFFTNVSHELRTPLTLLLGPTGDALADASDPLTPGQRARAELVNRNAERLLKLVNTLLDFSRMESQQVTGRFEPFDVISYTADLTAMFQTAAQRAGLGLRFESDPIQQAAYLDHEMWAKIVLNLISNAFKATFAGEIVVALRAHDGALALTVTDTGIGIPERDKRRLFERFYRVTGAELRSHEGSGIGLALVSELVAMHGGQVEVRSEVGVGSTFEVRIPLGAAHLPAEQVVTTSTATLDARRPGAGYVAESHRWFDDRPATGETREGPRSHPDRRRVLVVDDNPDMREYICSLLTESYAVSAARDGVEALELARAAPPDLILTDVMMPRLDGFGLLAALRDSSATMHVPVIMISARSGDEATISGLEAGADDYLIKPFSARELVARVRSNLELDRVRRVVDELGRSRELLDNAEQLAHVGSWEIDLADDSVIGSAEYFHILGVPPGTFSEGGLADALSTVVEPDRTRLAAALTNVRSGHGVINDEVRLQRQDGIRLLKVRGVLHRDDQGRPTFVRGSIQDITEQREAELLASAAAAAEEVAAREHLIAEELQRSLLPAIVFDPNRCRVAVYYSAGVQGTQAGGDWYEIIDLSPGRTALVLGDVMGRGIKAAGLAGQLRAAVQAYSRIGLSPERVLSLLDDTVCDIERHTIVTCVYAVYDANNQTLTYANAGHLPPLLTTAGTTRSLRVGGPPLGTGAYRGAVETIDVPDGTTLTLYTDGLVEHRGSDLANGIDRLEAVLSQADDALEALPNLVVDALLPHAPDDDVAVLVAALGGQPDSELLLHLSVEPQLTAIGVAREKVAEACMEYGFDQDTVANARLLVSELVTNAVRHARPPVELYAWADAGRLVLEVADSSIQEPAVRPLDVTTPGGRGLAIVSAISTTWGVRPYGRGKAVWCTLDGRTSREAVADHDLPA